MSDIYDGIKVEASFRKSFFHFKRDWNLFPSNPGQTNITQCIDIKNILLAFICEE